MRAAAASTAVAALVRRYGYNDVTYKVASKCAMFAYCGNCNPVVKLLLLKDINDIMKNEYADVKYNFEREDTIYVIMWLHY